MDSAPSLTTSRLLLRRVQHADAQAMLSIRGDTAAMQLMGRDPLQNLEQAHQLIAQFLEQERAPSPAYRWVLERMTDHTVLGTCGVFGWYKQWKKCSIGYELGRFAWGQGYMREAANAILHWTFENMQLHRIDALIHPENHASLKLAQHLGFKLEGRLRETAFWDGSYHDMLQLGLLRHDMTETSPIS
jgi:ribosomal-protein-alanine N-acetyltransferase